LAGVAYFRHRYFLNNRRMQKPISHIFSGLLVAAVVSVYTLILSFSGGSGNKSLGFVSLLLMVAGVAYFVWRHGGAVEELLSFGGLFSYGFKATAVMTLVLIGYNVLFYTLFPEYRDVLFDISREQMLQQPGITEEQVEMGISKMREFFWPIIIGGALFNTMMAGAVGSLIGAGITAKKQSHKG
jgi:hypothetical protein